MNVCRMRFLPPFAFLLLFCSFFLFSGVVVEVNSFVVPSFVAPGGSSSRYLARGGVYSSILAAQLTSRDGRRGGAGVSRSSGVAVAGAPTKKAGLKKIVKVDDESSPSQLDGRVGGPAGVALGLAVAVTAALAAALSMSDIPLSSVVPGALEALSDPSAFLNSIVDAVQGSENGYAIFAVVYVAAEVLAIPAIPLTASAGYLFGVAQGTTIVLCAAVVAAAISFLIGRTFLRSYVESLVSDSPRFKAIDRVIGKEGFKLILLLRLSPIFPFALSNYM